MIVDKNKTIEYYKTYVPCNCDDCKNYIAQIEDKFPHICEYLRSLGVDPLKPFELASVPADEENKILYLVCMYVVFGECEDEVVTTIDGLNLGLSKDNHLSTGISEKHFVIDFGPITMDKLNYIYGDKVSFEDKVKAINLVIDKYDPMQLLPMCPADEYSLEANEIAKKLEKANAVDIKEEIKGVFYKMFSVELSDGLCKKMAKDIEIKLNFLSTIADIKLQENRRLKNLEKTADGIKLTVHDGFIVTAELSSDGLYKTCINGKFFYNIEEQDFEESLKEFATDGNLVYVQYNKKRKNIFSLNKYFAVVKRDKFVIGKFVKDKNVECIFDNKEVLYRKSPMLPCRCCGYLTISMRGYFEICPVCYWEDDEDQFDDPDYKRGVNGISLKQAKKNYAEFGACDRRFRTCVRKPEKDELPTTIEN